MPQRYLLTHFAPIDGSPCPLARESFELGPPAPGQVQLAVRAISLNYRDLMIIRGDYNPKLALPTQVLSDAAGVVTQVGPGVTRFKPGDRVLTNFVSTWQKGPFCATYLQHTLGTPGPGLATQAQNLSEDALVAMPDALSFEQASTLPIAGLTAYSALLTQASAKPGQRVLTLGTGGVSMFVLALAKHLGLQVAITSSSDKKLKRCASMGADFTINYQSEPQWGRKVASWADGQGVDITVETGGIQSLAQSIRATKAGGTLSILGALSGLKGTIDLGPIMMRRLSLRGVMVDPRENLEKLVQLYTQSPALAPPIIAQHFDFEQTPQALMALAKAQSSEEHLGKIVIRVSEGSP